ncbi:CpsB/CapC family capsule biosynthesis tyrosine phosphatase, partial [Streptomyces sp. NPDC001833]
TGHFGKKIQKLSFKMIENHLTHFVASDAHNVTSRAFKMKEAFEIIEDSYGSGVSRMFQNNAESVIINESLYQEKPTKIKTKKFLGLF